nr:unnamed protein product [Ipomoea batatas]GMD51943.1 unnamed protein product [Ipomoea batatas]GMD55426.1 unnamed protein product [Ipomoea batatas]
MGMLWLHVLGFLSRILSLCNFIQPVYMELVVSSLKDLVVKVAFLGIVKVSDLWNDMHQLQRILPQGMSFQGL